MAVAEPLAQPGNGSPIALDASLQALAAHYGCLADSLDTLQHALREGNTSRIADASKAVYGLTRQTSAIHDEVLPASDHDTANPLSLIAHIQSVVDASPHPLVREGMMSAAQRVAQQMQRVVDARARIGTLPYDLIHANEQMLDVIRQLDGRGSTYDRTFTQRGNGRARNVFDTQA